MTVDDFRFTHVITDADRPVPSVRGWWVFLDSSGLETEIYCDGLAWFYWRDIHRNPPPYRLLGPAK